MGDFDKRMGQEQQELEKNRQAGAGAAGGASEDSEGTGQDTGSGGGGGMPGEIPADGSGQGQSESAGIGSAGAPDAGPRFPAPQGVPDGKDDDVVARQLREAAEREADPELRAKLWEEYRKYKSRKA